MLQYDIKQSPPNNVIVEVGAAIDTTVTYGAVTLHIDPEFNPTYHARIYGVVKAVPAGKVYSADGKEIEADVRVGDKIYFHYLTTNDETNCIYGNYYKVPYYWIFCIVRDGNILPVGSWTLCSKVVEERSGKIEVNGIYIDADVSSSGLVTKVHKTDSNKYAVIAEIGKPLVGESSLNLHKGDKVILDKNSNFINKIEEVEYYTVLQQYIAGKAELY